LCKWLEIKGGVLVGQSESHSVQVSPTSLCGKHADKLSALRVAPGRTFELTTKEGWELVALGPPNPGGQGVDKVNKLR
jgi:hypothetical protein